MPSTIVITDHGWLYIFAIAVIIAIVLVVALLRKDNVKATGRFKEFGFSLEASNHERK
jgi:choline-glycine betaine transporter